MSPMRVIATARRLDSIQDLRDKGAETLALDVTSPSPKIKEFAEKAIGVYGQIDILINNAGYLLGGAIEENTEEEIRAQFDTNFFGIINLTCALLPHLRHRKTGAIVNVSSQGAYLSISGAGIYCASKAAVDSISEVWARELAPFNIRCMTVNLGSFRTAVAGSNTKVPAKGEIEGYEDAHSFVHNFQGGSGQELGDPDKAADKIIDLLNLTDKPLPAKLPIGEDAFGNAERVLDRQSKVLKEYRQYGMGTNIDGLETEEKWFFLK
ncbi:hypothetical protein V5O48_005707 [Marasmius crinis-equi]|uniref:Uncharacterized protein n=1 Tax=Marasmius crinis-equi TaxID=585013 RepID=A0ABR3FM81_9AGAR